MNLARKNGNGARWRPAPAVLGGLGLLAFALGACVYFTDRAAGSALLVPSVPLLAGRHWFGSAGLWLPSFVHPFAFGLFTAALLRRGGSGRYLACLAWGAINVAFEFGQRAAFKPQLAEALHRQHGLLAHSAAMRPVLRYLLNGTYDPGDVIAAIAGALAAAALLLIVERHTETPHANPLTS